MLRAVRCLLRYPRSEGFCYCLHWQDGHILAEKGALDRRSMTSSFPLGLDQLRRLPRHGKLSFSHARVPIEEVETPTTSTRVSAVITFTMATASDSSTTKFFFEGESGRNTRGLLRLIILVTIAAAAVASRLFSVIRFESIIHECQYTVVPNILRRMCS